MPDIPSVEPQIIYAGETIQWTRSFADFPANEYTLKYYLTHATGSPQPVLTASAYNTTDHLVSVSATDSAQWTYGIYSWTAYAEKGAGGTLERYRVDTGFLTVKTLTGKSFAKIMLDAIEAILTRSATAKDLDIVAKSLGGTSISRDRDKLMAYRDRFRAEYQSELETERALEGKATGRNVLFRFRQG
jgi:hypothetical protein